MEKITAKKQSSCNFVSERKALKKCFAMCEQNNFAAILTSKWSWKNCSLFRNLPWCLGSDLSHFLALFPVLMRKRACQQFIRSCFDLLSFCLWLIMQPTLCSLHSHCYLWLTHTRRASRWVDAYEESVRRHINGVHMAPTPRRWQSTSTWPKDTNR